MNENEINTKLKELCDEINKYSFIEKVDYNIVFRNTVHIITTFKSNSFKYDLDVILNKIQGCEYYIKKNHNLNFTIDWI